MFIHMVGWTNHVYIYITMVEAQHDVKLKSYRRMENNINSNEKKSKSFRKLLPFLCGKKEH